MRKLILTICRHNERSRTTIRILTGNTAKNLETLIKEYKDAFSKEVNFPKHKCKEIVKA